MALDFEQVDLGGFGINKDQEELPTIEAPLNATMSEAVKVNPDQQAHINNLSKQSGIPTFAVESDPVQVESKLNFDNIDLSNMSKRSPKTAEYLVDFNNASIAHDDVGVLESIENVFDFGKTFENIGASIDKGFEGQVAGGVMTGIDKAPTRIEDIIPSSALPIGMKGEAFAMSQKFASDFGINTDEELQTAKVEATDKMIGRLRELKSVKEKLQPEDLNLLEQGVRAGVESLANMAPGIGLMLLSGGQAAPMLATMGIQTFGGSYADARADGLDPQKAGWFAGIDAAIEVGTEVLPVGQLENIITGGTKGLGKKALKFMIKEMGTEQLATLGQTINSYMFGLDDELEKAFDEKDFSKAANIQIQRQAVTAIATLVAGGAQASIATGANKAINAMGSEESKKQQAYGVEQQTIDRLNENSEKSKLKARDKESFKQFVEKADGENNTHVFIDASQVSLYLQTKTREEIENDTGLVLLDNQVREAAALDGEVQISVADFASELTGTDHFNQLRDSMTMSDQTVSPFRQEQEKQETAVYVRNLMAEAQENTSQYVEAQDIYTTVRQQLIDSGRVTPANATIMSQVVPAWATAQAKRSGKTVQQVYEESGLIIEGPLTGEKARLQEELNVFTQNMNYDETGQIERDDNFKKWFGDSQVVDEDGEPLVVYHGTTADFDEFDVEKIGSKIVRPIYGADIRDGFFFAKSEKIAGKYGGNIMSIYVNVKNPAPSYKEYLENEQYDGFINSKIVIARNPTQIKSVNNRGTFDPADPNILRQNVVVNNQTEVTQDNNTFKTGEPVTFNHAHNTDSATAMFGIPDKDSSYGRGFEPSGQYMTVIGRTPDYQLPNMEYGSTTFNNPLVIEADGTNWKQKLSEDFGGVTGKKLSKAVIAAGYDGIVTTEKDHVSEVVNLQTFDESKALFQSATSTPKNLIVTHNISETGLKHAIELGGLAAPSLAVVNTDVQELSGFGEITLIPKPDILDVRDSRTFDADIYSARQPRPTDKFNKKGLNQLLRDIENSIDGTGLNFDPNISNMNDLDKRSVFYHYLKSIGKAPKLRKPRSTTVSRAVKGVSPYDLYNNQKFINAVAKDLNKKLEDVAEKVSERDLVDEIAKGWFKSHPPKEYQLKDVDGGKAYFNGDKQVTEVSPGGLKQTILIRKYLNENNIDYEIDYSQPTEKQLSEYAQEVKSINKGYDSYKLKEDLNKKEKVKSIRSGFVKWMSETYDSVVDEKVLKRKRGRDVPYTLDNVVDEMTNTLRGGENFNYGPASIRAQYAKELKSRKEIQDRRDNFVTSKEMDKIRNESNDKFFKLTEELKKYYKYETDSFNYTSDIADAITNKDYRKFRSPTVVKAKGDDFGAYLAGLPTEYFEAKVQRAMDFSEFETALVPKGTKKETVDSLRNFGLKVKRYNGESETGRLDALKKEQKLLFQPTSPDAPGTRGYYSPEDSLIRLTDASDMSTFLHEFAHFMYEMELNSNTDMIQSIKGWYKRNSKAVAKEANRYAKKEFDAEKQEGGETSYNISHVEVETYLDTGTSGNEAKDSAIRRAVHEQFARGFETYLMEGKAPSIELRNAFRTFARWLSQVYQALKGDLNVNLDSEMRQVFDRLLATEEQIAAAEARARFEPMFTDAAMAGMTEEEFAKYQQQQSKVKDKQSETLRDKLIKQLTRQTKKWWKEEKQDIIDTKLETLTKERVYAARTRLKDGDLKLDFATTKEIAGEAKTDKRGRTMIRVSPKLRGMTAKENQGLHPDEAAAIFGYGSGSEMLDDLINAPGIAEVAETRAEAVMVGRHGDIMTDGTIERAADDAVQNEERGKLILKELKVLSKDTVVPTIDRMTIKNIATEKIGRLSFREIFPGKYRKAEIKAAQESTRMLAEGNRDGAAAAKMRQVMNYYLGMEASKAKADTMKIVDRMNRYNKKKVRVEIMKGDQSYMDQIDKILNRFEFKKSASLKSVEDINTWLKNKNENEGDALILSVTVLDEGYITHWKNVPYGDVRGISDSVKNIEHVARYANKIKLMGEQVDYTKVKQDWLDVIKQNKNRFKTKESRDLTSDAEAETKTEAVRRWASQLTKVPFIALWLDGGKRVGLSHQLLMQKLTDALDEKMVLTDKVMTPVIQLIENRTKEDKARHNRKIWIPEINKNVLGSQVLSVALNTGNAGNLKKMLLGEGWADPEIETDISFDNVKLQAILKHMNKNDWNLVQSIWDQMELLYPQLEEVHFKTTGIRPPKIVATPIENEFGTFKGGYYPVKYSRKRSHKANKNAEKAEAEVSSMFNNTASIQASVNAGATNERTGFYDRINLSLEVIPEHFNETIHYITHHEAVRQTNKLIQDPQIASAITAVLGESEYNLLKPWLNDVAKDGRQQPTKTYIDEIFQQLRTGTTLGVMGFKATTGIMQVFGLFTTAAELGTKTTLQGIYDTIGRSFYMKALRKTLGSTDDMQTGLDFANERSKVLPHRVKTMDREMSNAMKSLQGKRGILPAVQEASMKHIALIQLYMVDLPTWIAAYDKTVAETGNETKAAQYADWAIENLQGSGATKDMSAILRNQSKITTTFTMFMTFFSSLGNLGRDTVKGAKSGLYSPTSVAAKLMFLYTIPVVMEMLMRGELDEPDDDDDRLSSLMTGLALYPVTSIPFVRDVASGLFSGFGYNSSPVASVIEKGIMGYKQIGERSFTDKEITKSALKNASKLTGAVFGVPGINQMWSTGEHLYDVIEEGEDFTFRELFFGPKRN